MASPARNWDSLTQDAHWSWGAEGSTIGSLADREDWDSACPQPSDPAGEDAFEQQAVMMFNAFQEVVLVRQLEETVATLMAQFDSAIEMLRLAALQVPIQELSATWPGYLLSLSINGPLPSDQAIRALRLWEELRTSSPALIAPHATALDDGTFSMTWDKGPHHFEVELHPSGVFDWFYLDRSTDIFLGEEDLPIGYASRQMVDLLRKAY